MNPATNMTDDWIKRALAQNPCAPVTKDGVATGDYRTCPVRLSFPWLFKASKPIPPNTEGKFGASLLFWPGADLTVLKLAAAETAKAKWPKAGTPEGPKLKTPFLTQDEDCERYIGYQPGGVLIRGTASKAMPVVDQNLAPIVEEAKVYPGVWAICTLRPFAYAKGVNNGVSFGLQAVMIIADDQNIGGTGSADPNTAFAGVKIEANLNPSALFGADSSDAEAKAAADMFS